MRTTAAPEVRNQSRPVSSHQFRRKGNLKIESAVVKTFHSSRTEGEMVGQEVHDMTIVDPTRLQGYRDESGDRGMDAREECPK